MEAGELPEEGARREVQEEAGLEPDGDLELVGAYPMFLYGHDVLQLSYRGRVAGAGGVVLSAEHTGARWVRPADLRQLLTDEPSRRSPAPTCTSEPSWATSESISSATFAASAPRSARRRRPPSAN